MRAVSFTEARHVLKAVLDGTVNDAAQQSLHAAILKVLWLWLYILR